MRNVLPLIALLLTSSAAFAQSRVYTNADLSQRPMTWTRTVTAQELASLERRQFRLPQQYDEPTAIIVGYEEPSFVTYDRPLSAPSNSFGTAVYVSPYDDGVPYGGYTSGPSRRRFGSLHRPGHLREHARSRVQPNQLTGAPAGPALTLSSPAASGGAVARARR